MVYVLPDELTIARVASVWQELLPGVQGSDRLALDPRSVTSVDAAGLQLLCAAVRSGAAEGPGVDFVDGDCGAVIRRAMQSAGLTSFDGSSREVRHG